MLGIACILAAIPFVLLVRDKATEQNITRQSPFTVLATLMRKPVFWLISLGTAAGGIGGTGILFWLPSLLQRSYGLSLVEAGQFVAAQLLIASTAGMMLGGILGDRAGQRDRGSYAGIPAWAFLLCAPGFAVALANGAITPLFILLIVPFALAFVWNGPVIMAIQHVVAAQDRCAASACFLLVVNLIAFGLGAPLIGVASDAMSAMFAGEALRYAMMVSLVAFIFAAILLFLAAPKLRKAWQD